MIVIDLSKSIFIQGPVPNETMGYADPPIDFDNYVHGKPFRITQLLMGVHSGTHCDTPSHFLFDKESFVPKADTITDYPLDTFVGRAVIIDLISKGIVERDSLLDYRTSVRDGKCIPIIRNRRHEPFTPSAREELASWRPKLIIAGEGWDTPSPQDRDAPYPDTEFFLSRAQIPVIMDADHLMMRQVRNNDLIVAAPIKLDGAEASPVRLIAIRDT